ncbi:preQ(1) synthase [Poriferisphaera sp. WC338]|uniref:preQ(1) synthase n=1 Tax=Poriferisphaera sp. WC338 TaxID=3425129 RepID=UPI003D81910F
MADKKILECFDNPNLADGSGHDFVIEHVADEFTSVCPKTGHPDFGTVTLIYVPDKTCVELKSLKLYYQAYRNEGIFYEAVTNAIARDLNDVMQPKWMCLETNWKGRGGIRSTISVEFGTRPDHV